MRYHATARPSRSAPDRTKQRAPVWRASSEIEVKRRGRCEEASRAGSTPAFRSRRARSNWLRRLRASVLIAVYPCRSTPTDRRGAAECATRPRACQSIPRASCTRDITSSLRNAWWRRRASFTPSRLGLALRLKLGDLGPGGRDELLVCVCVAGQAPAARDCLGEQDPRPLHQ